MGHIKAETESEESLSIHNASSSNSPEKVPTIDSKNRAISVTIKNNLRLAELIEKLISSYNSTALIEKHRVFPYILSAVNKILSRIFRTPISTSSTAASFNFSSSSTGNPFSILASSSKLILSVVMCFHQSLKGLNDDNLDVILFDFSKLDMNTLSTNAAATSMISDDITNTDEFHENCDRRSIDETLDTNFESESGRNNIKSNNENSSIYDKQNSKDNNNDDKDSKIKDNKTNYDKNYDVEYLRNFENGRFTNVDEISVQSMEEKFSLSEAIIVFSKTEIIMSKIVFLLTMCMENVKVREIENTKTLSNRSVVTKIDNQKNNDNNNSNNIKNNFGNDDASTYKKELNADDDDIISECFQCLKLSQLYWTLHNIKMNKITDIEMKAEVESTEKNKSNFLKPFSGFYLAQFIQFSLYFSTSR